jgi:signal transduction histidine kinase
MIYQDCLKDFTGLIKRVQGKGGTGLGLAIAKEINIGAWRRN